MIIIGLDISKANTGWAVWDTSRHQSSMIIGSFKSEGETFFDTVEDFHPRLTEVVRRYKPQYAAIEESLPNIKAYEVEKEDMAGTYTRAAVNSSQLILPRLIGSAQSILRGFRVPRESVDSKTWRKAFLGYGTKKGFQSADWKKAARQQCEIEGIDVKNNDQAEAVGIAFWAGRCSQHVKMLQAEFDKQRNERQGVAA